MKYEIGDRVIISQKRYNGILEYAIIEKQHSKEKDFYYIEVKYKSSGYRINLVKLHCEDFKIDPQYYREKRLKHLLDEI